MTPSAHRGPGADDGTRRDDRTADASRSGDGPEWSGDAQESAAGAWWAGDGDPQDPRETEVPPVAGARTARPAPRPGPGIPGGAGAAAGDPDGRDDGTPAAALPALPPSSRARRPRDPWLPEHPPFRTLSGPDIAGIVLLGAVGIAVLVVLGLFVLHRFGQRDPVAAAPPRPTVASSASGRSTASTAPTRSGTPSATPSVDLGTPGRLQGSPYVGALDRLSPTGVTASCTDAPTQDSNGDTTYYDASQATDDQPRTAWRCAGPSVGERLTLRFDRPTSVAELSITNGWARRDSGTDRYYQYRRVQKVRWSFDGNRFVEQSLDDRDPTPQTLRIAATVTSSVVVEIEDTSTAGRDATPISELAVAGPPGGLRPRPRAGPPAG